MRCLKSLPILVFAFFFVFAWGVMATNDLEKTGAWSSFGNDEGATSNYGHSNGVWGLSNSSLYDTLAYVGYGAAEFPLVADIDLDGNNEIITKSTSYLEVFRVDPSGALVGVGEYLAGNLTAGLSLANVSGRVLIVGMVGNVLNSWFLNASGLFLNNSLNLSAEMGISGVLSGVSCSDFKKAPYCFLIASNNPYKMVRYDPVTNGYLNRSVKRPFSTTYNNIALADWDSDNILEVGYAGYGTGSCRTLTVYDSNFVLEVNTTIGSCSGSSKSNSISNVAFYDADGFGSSNLWALDGWGATVLDAGVSLYAVNTAGAVEKTYSVVYTSGAPHTGTPRFFAFGGFTGGVFGSFGVVYRGVCAFGSNSWSAANKIRCFRTDTNENNLNITGLQSFYPFIVADLDSDGFDDVVTSQQVISPQKNVHGNLSASYAGYNIVSDVVGDANLEIVGSKVMATYVYTAGESIALDIYGISLNGREPDRNLRNPVCVGSTVSFQVKDCFAFPLYDSCNYLVSDNSSLEYLFTTCGTRSIIGPYFATAVPSDAPSVDCYYNVSGTYSFDVYVTNPFIGSSPVNSEGWRVSVEVINGTSGTDCNLGPYIGSIPLVILPIPAESASVKDLLTAGGQIPAVVAGLLILVVCVLAVVVLLVKSGVNDGMVLMFGGGIAFVVAFLGLVIYGLLPVWILIVGILFASLFWGIKAYSRFSGAG